jgi:hypothetical protein
MHRIENERIMGTHIHTVGPLPSNDRGDADTDRKAF